MVEKWGRSLLDRLRVTHNSGVSSKRMGVLVVKLPILAARSGPTQLVPFTTRVPTFTYDPLGSI